MLKRYDVAKDDEVEVTQQWVDDMQKLIGNFGLARHISKEMVEKGLDHDGRHKAFLDAWTLRS